LLARPARGDCRRDRSFAARWRRTHVLRSHYDSGAMATCGLGASTPPVRVRIVAHRPSHRSIKNDYCDGTKRCSLNVSQNRHWRDLDMVKLTSSGPECVITPPSLLRYLHVAHAPRE
jgi:hypothetical protein